MNKLKLLTFLLLFILLPTTIYADCTKEEIDHFKKIENEYKVNYEYNSETKTYDITLYNSEPDKYLQHIDGLEDHSCEEISAGNYTCYNFAPQEYKVYVLGITDTCDDVLKITNLKLSKNNNYSSDPLCEGIEEFVLCQPTYDKDIDYDTFVSRVNTYKKTKQREAIEEEKNNTKNNETINNILKFFKENAFQIIIIILFVTAITVTIILTAKSIRKSRRLE